MVDKYGYGGFHDATLENVLRAHGVTQLVVTGTVTQICVEETLVREAFHRELEVVVVSDGVAYLDEELASATLRNLAMKFGRVETTVSAVLAALQPAVA